MGCTPANLVPAGSVPVSLTPFNSTGATATAIRPEFVVSIQGGYCNPNPIVNALLIIGFEDGSPMYFEDGLTPIFWESV
jgi:hypothetical protein